MNSGNQVPFRLRVRYGATSPPVANAEFGLRILGVGSTAAPAVVFDAPSNTFPMFPARALETAREARALPATSIALLFLKHADSARFDNPQFSIQIFPLQSGGKGADCFQQICV
jgi:hypothetical protein